MDSMFTCPCCGYEVFPDHPGSYDICPIYSTLKNSKNFPHYSEMLKSSRDDYFKIFLFF
ncbi:CPCC family cysteine-rich protein [Massilia sp. MB5]|uniref:CPCC family cysteine-rich protein n=1 Tax=Massilia sp. MB5 TaxID=2919578 RepID=UPI0035A3C96F